MARSHLRERESSGELVQGSLLHLWRRVARSAPAVSFVVLFGLCWGLGGATRENEEFRATLEVLSIGCLFIALLAQRQLSIPPMARPLALMLGAFIVVVCIQLIPLPWGVWASLPGHGPAADGASLLGLPHTARPLSLAPENTVSALLQFVPAVATFILALALPWRSLFEIVKWGAPAAGLVSAILGLVQVFAGRSEGFHLYDWTNAGVAAGLFANVNHQAGFLLMCLPFATVLAAQARSRWRRGQSGLEPMLLLAPVVLLLLVGIAVAGSLAGYILAPFVVIGCATLLTEKLKGFDARYIAAGIALTVAALALALSSPRLQGLAQSDYLGGERARSGIHGKTLEAAADFVPLGSGLGSFESVYPLYEEPDSVEETYVNHAHNDYLEILLELGLPGACILLAFLIWWMRVSFGIWFRPSDVGSFQRMKMAASLAIAVVLIHSLVDYPLRTISLAAFVAVCIAIMVRSRGEKRTDAAAPAPVLSVQT